MPSHGHGQGYADTHFLIPETVDVVDVHKGPYAARFGDFYTAGAMELKTLDEVDGPTAVDRRRRAARRAASAFDQYNRRIVGMASPEIRDNETDKSLIAAADRRHRRPVRQPAATSARATRSSSGRARSAAAASSSRPPGTRRPGTRRGRSPSPRSPSGLIDRFGSLDPSEGGDTSRTSAQLGYASTTTHGGTWRAIGVRPRLPPAPVLRLHAVRARPGARRRDRADRRALALRRRRALRRAARPRRHGHAHHHRRRRSATTTSRTRCGTTRSACGSRAASARRRTRATTPTIGSATSARTPRRTSTCSRTSTCCPACASSSSSGTSTI